MVAVIEGAAHAINFSHPGELANVIRLFMADEPIVDDPDSPGHATAYEIHRGAHLPPREPTDKPRASRTGHADQAFRVVASAQMISIVIATKTTAQMGAIGSHRELEER